MEKDSALYQLMDTCMNGVINSIVNSDGEYQEILRRSDVYSGELERMELPEEVRLLIDRYVCEHFSICGLFSSIAFSPFALCQRIKHCFNILIDTNSLIRNFLWAIGLTTIDTGINCLRIFSGQLPEWIFNLKSRNFYTQVSKNIGFSGFIAIHVYNTVLYT